MADNLLVAGGMTCIFFVLRSHASPRRACARSHI
jgi:hypothetical protein